MNRVPLRRVAPFAVLVAAVATTALAVVSTPLALGALAVLVGAAAAAATIDGRARTRELRRRLDAVDAAQRDVLAQLRSAEGRAREADERTGLVLDQLVQLGDATAAQDGRAATLADRLEDRHAQLLRRLERADTRTERRLQGQFGQIEALLALYRDLEEVGGLPPTGGWAASADLLGLLWRSARERRPELIVECGSGTSTIVLAAACRANGSGRVVALDHDATFAQQTRDRLAVEGLDAWAEVRHAPIEARPVDGETHPWYAPHALPDGPIGLLLVDGPPKALHEQARYPALPYLADRLAPDVLVIVDDYHRPGERATVARWVEERGPWQLTELPLDKGAALLERPPPEA